MKIGELGAATGTKVETIRYYEQIGILPPPARTASNYRSYCNEHVQRLSFVRRARDLGFPLEQVRELLSLSDTPDRGLENVAQIARAHLATVQRKRAELKALGRELERMLEACAAGRISNCGILRALAEAPPPEDCGSTD